MADESYRRIVEAVGRFIESDEFYYLRSDTRRDFEHFREDLSNGNAVRNRHECEGFDKYLDSLAFVSQRGVLIKHDTDLRAKITDDLERAVQYAQLLPEISCEVIEQAFVKGERLSGLSDQIDAVVLAWASMTEDQRADLDQVVALGRQLLELVRPPPAPPPAEGGDFF